MNIKTTELSSQFQFPLPLLWAVALLCILPIILNLLGVNFASQGQGFNIQEVAAMDLPKGALLDRMFYTLTGGLHHGLLEWSAVVVAYLTILLAFAHFAINKDITTPIIGIALFCSGTMDAFHTLAAMRLIDAAADNSNLIPFTWALSRGFNAGILIVGVLLCLGLKQTSSRLGLYPILIISVVFGGIAYGLIHYSAISANLPQTQFPDAIITRPYDVIPLVLFCIAAPIFWRLYRTTPNLLTAALLISLLPEVVLEAHMSFGSSKLFDNHFNIAHFLKIFAYLVPFIGLVLDYIRTYQNEVETANRLEEREERLQAIMNTAVDAIITITPLGKITSFNQSAEKIFGYTADEIIGSNIKYLTSESHQDKHDSYLSNYITTGIANVIGSGGRELEARRKDGSEFPIDLGVSEVKLGEERSFVGIIRDISIRKANDEKLAHTIEDLRLSNEELEKFAYVASHDLKSPLRAIDNLSLWLDEDLGEALTGKNKEHMEKLRGRVTRMDQLLDDLLNYCRAGQSETKNVPIMADDLINDIINLLDVPNGFQVKVDDSLKNCNISKSPLDQIFRNLIGNAIKHHDKAEGTITVSMKPNGQYNEFTVEDDGPGIDPKFHDKVFEMFQTLKPRDEVEGSGMGMAMVKKLLFKHGGRIDLDSDVDQGTRVNFTWPK